MKLAEIMEKQYGIEMLPDTPVYAMAYVPFQGERVRVFSPDQGFMLGTMFPALNKPFYGAKCGDPDD